MINIENYLQDKLEDYGEDNLNRMIDLYEGIPSPPLQKIFSKIHFETNRLLKYLNERLPRKGFNRDSDFIGHYTANESRELIHWIEEIKEIQSHLKGTKLQFEIVPYYQEVLKKCNDFLEYSGGSPIPKGVQKVQLISLEPIFVLIESIEIERKDVISTFSIKLIGEGSYAQVFKYKDSFYNRFFIIKRAKKDLNDKERERFKREFEEMSKLKSPYIVEVFSFDKDRFQYTMEYMDTTLYDYIMANNMKLEKGKRQVLVYQILKAFDYIHSKELLHRDISLKNVLLKQYEDVIVVKISDFGLVKLNESNLTSTLTEFKGSLNDPDLEIYGFKNYKMEHETYALTRLIYFIMTGKTRIDKFNDKKLETFVKKGLDKDITNRYSDKQNLRNAFRSI